MVSRGKSFLLVAILLTTASVINANLILTVNGLDASKPIEIEQGKEIIIAIAGQTNEQKESYSVTCEMGGKLTSLSERNSLVEKSKESDYLLTFESKELGLVTVNLTIGDVLDYQLILFNIPDANTIVFGIDSDEIEIPEPEPEPDIETEQVDLQFPYDSNIVPYAQRKEQEKEESLKYCPTGQGLVPVTEKLSRKAGKDRELSFSSKYDSTIMGGRGIIDVNSDITSNQVWTPDNTYHIAADVNVQALLVVEPGTVVKFAADKAMFVNNGGSLISVGTPNNPVVYTSDSGTPGYADYYCPMYIEETASPTTKIMYSYVEYAYIGLMVLNNKLKTDITNNYFYNNLYGIIEFGTKHTNIVNNLCFGSYYSGIEVFLASMTDVADANSFIKIENNTCDYYHDDGIVVHGVPDLNDAGVAVLANNIVSGSYEYGLALVDDYMYATVTNTGYFDNTNNKNWAFDENNPVFETTLPYKTGAGILPICYLTEDCNFIDVGNKYMEQTHLIGMTTDVNSAPDSNFVDIGFHYSNWDFSNPGSGGSLSADFDDSLRVDFGDIAKFADYWQQPTNGETDLDGSGFVDYNDLSIFTTQWLQVADPNIEISISESNIDGYADVEISGYNENGLQMFLLRDGRFIDNFGCGEDKSLLIDIAQFGKTVSEFKVISLNNNGEIICSNIKPVDCNFHPIDYRICNDAYEANEPYSFFAYSDDGNDISVTVFDDEGNAVWNQTYSGNNVMGSIPSTITEEYTIDYLEFEKIPDGRNSGNSVLKKVELSFNPKKVDSGVRALLVLPSGKINHSKANVHNFVENVFEDNGVPCYTLKKGQATSSNISWFIQNRNIEYLYLSGDGHYHIEDVLRTVVELEDGPCFSVKLSDYANPESAPSWIKKLPGNYEKTGKSFAMLGFQEILSLKFAYFDCCHSGKLKINDSGNLVEGQPGFNGLLDAPYSDISWALGICGTYESQYFQGWYDECPARLIPPSTFGEFTIDEFSEFDNGDNLFEALNYAIDESNIDPRTLENPMEHFRLKGIGYMTDIKID